ncbi:hypothetical protein BON22_2425 [Cyberlindnera fabianii]|uniref:Uncharacterized protein n=1 Tax=Cyberlindnera fabianii TaxID=36022 RepID=A0A1V2L689_CYBFA|nr:hypothetical protein BON22_2425 [Cyberlindnera fabianii]
MSLPPANNDPVIPPLRHLLQSVYTPIFSTFPLLQSIISQLSTASKTLPTLIRDDIQWARGSLDEDVNKLKKIQDHIKFLGAEETHTEPSEMMKVFAEVMDFTELILLDDFVEVLKGINEGLKDEEKAVLKVKNKGLDAVVTDVKRFVISLKVVAKSVRDLQHFEIEQIKKLELEISPRLDDLEKRFDALLVLA